MSVSNSEARCRERSYDFCVYRGCVNGKFTTSSRLYRFPKVNDPRLAVWVENTGNKRLKILAAASLRNSGLCEKHFEPNCFVGENRRLVRDAVPKVFAQTKAVPAVESNEFVTEKVVRPPSPNESDDERNSTVSEVAVTENAPAIATKPSDAAAPATTALSADTAASSRIASTAAPATTITPTLSSGASAGPAPIAKILHSGMVREYKKVAVIFSKSNKQNCTLMKLAPLKRSTVASPEIPTVRVKRGTVPSRESPESQPEPSTVPSRDDPPLRTLRKTLPAFEREISQLKRANETLKERNLAYRRTMEILKAKGERLQARNEYLKIKAENESVDAFLDRHECTEPGARAMIKLQVHHKKAPYTEEEKLLAKQLYYFSPSAYKCLRYAGLSLPSGSSVRNWSLETDVLN